MNRDAAIEAGARALRAVSARLPGDPSWDHLDEPLRRMYRTRAAAVIDAATPHLVGEPIGYGKIHPSFDGDAWVLTGVTFSAKPPTPRRPRVVAIVPVEDQP